MAEFDIHTLENARVYRDDPQILRIIQESPLPNPTDMIMMSKMHQVDTLQRLRLKVVELESVGAIVNPFKAWRRLATGKDLIAQYYQNPSIVELAKPITTDNTGNPYYMREEMRRDQGKHNYKVYEHTGSEKALFYAQWMFRAARRLLPQTYSGHHTVDIEYLLSRINYDHFNPQAYLTALQGVKETTNDHDRIRASARYVLDAARIAGHTHLKEGALKQMFESTEALGLDPQKYIRNYYLSTGLQRWRRIALLPWHKQVAMLKT